MKIFGYTPVASDIPTVVLGVVLVGVTVNAVQAKFKKARHYPATSVAVFKKEENRSGLPSLVRLNSW